MAAAILTAIVRATAIKVVARLRISAAKASASACRAARSAGDQPVCAGAGDSGRAVELCQAAYFRAVGLGCRVYVRITERISKAVRTASGMTTSIRCGPGSAIARSSFTVKSSADSARSAGTPSPREIETKSRSGRCRSSCDLAFGPMPSTPTRLEAPG